MVRSYLSLLVSAVIGLSFLSGSVWADSRHFTYSYEADSVLEKGKWEFEQWLTFRGGREQGKFYAFDFREEIEYGLLSRLTTALYLNFRDVHNSTADPEDRFEFKGVSSEWKYMVASPHLHPLGLLLYFEPTYEGEEFKLEGKVVTQHNFGDRWIWVANATIEPEWEFEADETVKELELIFTMGLAYKLSPYWSVGIEARSHTEFADFNDYEHTAFFAGPNIHYEKGKGWATFTLLPQIASAEGGRILDEHEMIEARLIAGILF